MNAQLSFVHNDDRFTVIVSRGEIVRIVWIDSHGGLVGDYSSVEQLPPHLSDYITYKVDSEYSNRL